MRGGASGRLRRLLDASRGRKHGLIVIYRNPDPDALASAWALQRVLSKWRTPTVIAYTGELGRLENQAMVDYLGIPAGRLEPAAAERADLVAVVDAQPSFFPAGELPRCDIVIDHHPAAGPAGACFTDIRPSCLATSSILTEYLQAAGCRVDRRIATALYYGIVTDAWNLDRAKTRTDSSALEALDHLVNRKTLKRIECSAYSLGTLDSFAIAIIKLRHQRGVFYADVGMVASADVCAQIADFLIHVKEARWALVSGVFENTLVVVFRCDGEHGNAGRTAAAAFGRFGSAGGHNTMGRAEIPASALPPGTLLTQGERIERFVLERLAKTRKVFGPVLEELLRAY